MSTEQFSRPLGVNPPDDGWQYFGRGPVPGADDRATSQDIGIWRDEFGRWDYGGMNGRSPAAHYCLRVGSPIHAFNFKEAMTPEPTPRTCTCCNADCHADAGRLRSELAAANAQLSICYQSIGRGDQQAARLAGALEKAQPFLMAAMLQFAKDTPDGKKARELYEENEKELAAYEGGGK